ncbi:Ca-activated chloride channel homolog [Candidatus Planktophila dulcis]|uniref:vWA domain-containing protein n=1 Tax=Candidatus Planktophila dulcis TaxID=1884914 RepID=UPI000BAC731E|nr:VWA domain-containing protein [Candidatus Planktophila dulcis]ASY14403.1 Ca-activated chloride channel homolog [Candidatus Planktophila dulcis]
MRTKFILDTDLAAHQQDENLTLLVEIKAPLAAQQSSRPAQGVVLAIDNSGSMEGSPLDAAKSSALKLLSQLDKKDWFGLITFDDTARVVVPMRRMGDHDLPAVKQAIRNIEDGASTDISAGYTMALRQARICTAEAGTTVLLISDGHANTGQTDPDFFTGVASKAATEKISCSTIGLSNGYDEKILEAIAQGGGGGHRFASGVDEAVGAFAAEFKDLLEKVAVNVVMKLTPSQLAEGHPTIEIIQRLPFWRDGNDYFVQLGDFYSGEERRFVMDLSIPGIAALGLCKVAEISIEYLDLQQKCEVQVVLPVHVNVVPADVAAGRVEDPVVRAERLILSAQAEKAIATQELQAGKTKEASARLKGTAENLRRVASAIRVVDERTAESLAIILEEANDIEVLAETAEVEDAAFSQKRLHEDFSRKTRSRSQRPPTENSN